jgi:hypothetical protein
MATVTTSIPVPARGRKGPEPKYAFTKLKPGESVLEDKPRDISPGLFVSRVMSSVAFHRKTDGHDYVARAEGDSIRIWRVK